jgi:hypothetical protein
MSTPETTPPAEKGQRMIARTTNPVNFSEWIFRLVIFIVFVCSVSVAWWSLTRVLLPLQKQSRELSTRVSRLSSEVDDLELKWNKTDASRINEKFGQIHSGLFIGDQALGNWVSDLKTQATPLGLDVQAEFGNTSPETNSLKLAKILTTVNVDVHPSSGIPGQPSAYQRILQFSQFLSTGEKRADLTEVTVSGGTNSIRHVVFVLNLWAGEEAPQ